MRILLCVAALLAPLIFATPLDDYVSAPDPNYKWEDTGHVINCPLGGKGYVLNVTSQQWLDTSKAAGPYQSAIWWHQVVVIIPRKMTTKNVSLAYLTGNCNDNPGVPSSSDEDIIVTDLIAHRTEAPAIVVFQIPNCPIVYPADPNHQRRSEDAMIAFAWHQFLNKSVPTSEPDNNIHDPEWLPRLPMTKGAMAAMTAAQDFMLQKKLSETKGWLVAGASKRGWTTWMVGAVTCPTCPTILGIVPLVPIVPSLIKEMHWQWRCYNGFTFAFNDYTALNLTLFVDDPVFALMSTIVDPISYADRLSRIPKVVVMSSDDEFMEMDWSAIWYDELSGEKHLFIAPDSEHSLSTGIPEVLETIGTFAKSVAKGQTQAQRPSFTYTRDNTTGEISVTIPQEWQSGVEVILRHSHTQTNQRRDFRWVRKADPPSTCVAPDIPLPKPIFGGNCLQPILWYNTSMTSDGSGTYSIKPPAPINGRWTGYYVEMFFPSPIEPGKTYRVTSPGFAWPDTFPYPDCHATECIGRLV